MTRKKILLILILCACAAAVKVTGVSDYLTFDSLKTHKEAIHLYVDTHPVQSPLAYVVVYATAVALSVPGAVILTLAGGFLFGTIRAAILVNMGATIGSAVVFIITKYLLGDWLQRRYEKQLERFNSEMASRGRNYLLTVRFIPIFPFFLINILAGLTRIRLWTFIWTTAVGILPGDLVYSFAGSRLDTINSAGDVLSPNILSAFLALVFLSISPLIFNLIKKRRGARKNVSNTPDKNRQM